jgi:hypothetical protein
MSYCYKCGADVKDGYKFCSICGAPANVTVTSKAPLMKFDCELNAFIPLTDNKITIPAGEGAYLKAL